MMNYEGGFLIFCTLIGSIIFVVTIVSLAYSSYTDSINGGICLASGYMGPCYPQLGNQFEEGYIGCRDYGCNSDHICRYECVAVEVEP